LLHAPEHYDGWKVNKRPPAVGDRAVVVERLSEDDYIVECSGPDGVDIWLGDFKRRELRLVANAGQPHTALDRGHDGSYDSSAGHRPRPVNVGPLYRPMEHKLLNYAPPTRRPLPLWRRLRWWEWIPVGVLVALLLLMVWMCAMSLYDPTYWD
jgi:hypothetical protein